MEKEREEGEEGEELHRGKEVSWAMDLLSLVSFLALIIGCFSPYVQRAWLSSSCVAISTKPDNVLGIA